MIHPASVAARRLGSRPGCFRIIDEPPGLAGRSAPNSGRATPATDPRVKSYMARSSGLVNVPDPQVSSPPRYPVLRRMCRRQEAHWLFKPSTASPPRNRRRIRPRHLELTVQRLPCRHNRCASRTQRILRVSAHPTNRYPDEPETQCQATPIRDLTSDVPTSGGASICPRRPRRPSNRPDSPTRPRIPAAHRAHRTRDNHPRSPLIADRR